MIRAAVLGSLMISFILLLRALLGKRLPRLCFKLLWIVAAIRLLIPISFTVDVEIEMQRPVAVEMSADGISAEAVPIAYNNENAKAHGADITLILSVIHIFGATASGGFMIIAYIRMYRLAAGGTPFCHSFAFTKKRVCVRCRDGYESPFSCGLLRPIIFIPTHMLELPKEQLDMVLAHEEQHIRSFDQPIKWLLCAAACLNWYNPLAWVMLRFANRDTELACDEAVVRRTGEKAAYALTLIAAKEIGQQAAVCTFGAPVLKERIEFIMRSKKTTICGFIAAGAILSLMTVFFVHVNAVEKTETEDAYSESVLAVPEEITDKTPTEQVTEEVETACVTHICYTSETEAREEVELMCPLNEYGGITSSFGYSTNPVGMTLFNNGVNVSAAEGEPVYAAASGTVVTAEYNVDDGYTVVIDHGDCVTYYRHCAELAVEAGDAVYVGERIASVGSTGKSTGPNLGFSVCRDGAFVDPSVLFE